MNIYQEIREYLETIYPEVRHYSDSLFRQIYKCKVPGKRKMDVIEAGARSILYNGKKIGSNLDDLKKFFSGTVTESLSLDEAQVILNENGYLMESTEDDIVAQIAKVIGGVYEILKVHEIPISANWLTKEYKIHTSGTSYWVEFRKGFGFEYRGQYYPWRVCIKHPTRSGFEVVAYNMSALKKYFKQAKEIQQNESYKNEIPDDTMDLALEVLNHSCYNLDYDVYQLAEMGEDWLKDLLNELNDREMRRACM